MLALKARVRAVAGVGVDLVQTLAMVLAGLRLAVVDVGLAVVARETGSTDAIVSATNNKKINSNKNTAI